MNGVLERRNRTLLDMVRSMMSFLKLPLSLWGYVLETTTRVLNVLLSKSVASLEGIVPIGCKWIFKKKISANGQIDIFKARLVAKGYHQRQDVDYDKTFSPVVMIKSITILLTIVVNYNYELWKMDVKTAFLNGNLGKEVYMIQLEGYTSKEFPERMCRLQRSIYGLKQAFRS